MRMILEYFSTLNDNKVNAFRKDKKFLFVKYKAESMYAHPQQGVPVQPIRYSNSAQQQPTN